MTDTTQLRKPRPLAAGDTIRVVAPASPYDIDAFRAGVDVLRGWGYRVQWRDDIEAADRHLAGSDERRTAEFMDALRDPDARAVLAARGGSGTLRLLPHLQPPTPEQIPFVMGFSDVTALLCWCEQVGRFVTWHGPVVTQLARLDAECRHATEDILFGSWPDSRPLFDGLRPMRGGRAWGTLRGGNLSLLGALAGTPWQTPLADTLLIVEDTGEPLYRLDRLVTQLSLLDGWSRLAGVVLGDFGGLDDGEVSWLADRFETLTEPSGCPVVRGAPVGHGARNQAFPMGVGAELDADAGHLTLVESPWV